MAHEIPQPQVSGDDWAKEAEARLLDAALPLAPSVGWSWTMARGAGRALGFSDAETELLIPHGPADLAALLARRHDAQALATLAELDPSILKISERIARAVEARLCAVVADIEAVRCWAGYLALPQNLPLAGRLLWASADTLWRWAGDTAADENHYSKRAILSGILSAGLAIWLRDGRDAAMAFVEARIGDVMTYERWKAGVKPPQVLSHVASVLGKLRYG